LLTGFIFDGEGDKLTASHAVKSGKRYQYYCQAVTQQGTDSGSSTRVPAHDIERRVVDRIAEFLQSEQDVMDQLGAAEESAESIQTAACLSERCVSAVEVVYSQRSIRHD
jgi:site-specific DNA recombinase